MCACCAPHVKKTGEIGMLNVQSLSNYKGGVRISILSGFRALEEERKKITGNFFYLRYTFRQSGVTARTCGKIKTVNQDLKYKLAQAKQKLVEQKMKEIPADQENVLLFETDLDTRSCVTPSMDLWKRMPGSAAFLWKKKRAVIILL